MFFNKRKTKNLFFFIGLFLLILTASCNPNTNGEQGESSHEKQVITIATGGVTGPYFAVGNGLASLLEREIPDLSVSVRSTGGGVENIQLLLDKKAELGLAMADITSFAYYGENHNEQKNGHALRAIASLYPNYVHIITLEGSGITKIEDLRGKRVGVGAVGSGTEVNARTILKFFGITYDQIDEQYLSYKESVDELKYGNIDAAFLTSGLPNDAILDLVKTNKVHFLPISKEKVEEISKQFPYYMAQSIPTGTYQNNQPISTAAITNILLTRADLPEDTVYKITKTIFDHIEEVHQTHKAAEDISLQSCLNGLPIPLHEGAKKYYKEQKVK